MGSDVLDAVRQLWRAANGICAKRLKPFLPTLIETLERCGHLKLEKQLKKKDPEDERVPRWSVCLRKNDKGSREERA